MAAAIELDIAERCRYAGSGTWMPPSHPAEWRQLPYPGQCQTGPYRQYEGSVRPSRMTLGVYPPPYTPSISAPRLYCSRRTFEGTLSVFLYEKRAEQAFAASSRNCLHCSAIR